MLYHLDTFSVFQGVLVASGYSETGAPCLSYDGIDIATLAASFPRPDLVAAHGSAAQHWGFKLCAMLPTRDVAHKKLKITFADGTTVAFPGGVLQAQIDQGYGGMLAHFRSETQRGGRLLEIGSRARSGNTYRDWFGRNIDYVGLDVTDGPNVDVVGDAHHLSRHVTGTFDFVLSISVFEHILMPWKVAIELSKVMADGGMGFIQSHSAFPLHEEPWDFFRYSKDAWKGIFNAHTGFEVVDCRYALKAWTIPNYAAGSSAEGMDNVSNYLLSACLIRKIGPSRVAWDAEASEVYDLNYSHA